MSLRLSKVVWIAAGIGAIGVGVVAWRFAFFLAPFAWTGEPARLARVLRIQPGMEIADIGAGSGALAAAMASHVGSSGVVYATELTTEQRDAIERRVRRAELRHVRVIAAGDTATGLPDRCCDAVYMRAVFHHVADQRRFAVEVSKTLRPGGRVAVIDFSPGTLWFHGADHGVTPESVQSAFHAAGLRLVERDEGWGGGMFLLAFERDVDTNGSVAR